MFYLQENEDKEVAAELRVNPYDAFSWIRMIYIIFYDSGTVRISCFISIFKSIQLAKFIYSDM